MNSSTYEFMIWRSSFGRDTNIGIAQGFWTEVVGSQITLHR
ncbi:unnamed protein product [Musa textilis]